MDQNKMDQIIPNLWIGSLQATKDVEALKANNIHSILSAMRGRVKIHETFLHFQVQLDDESDADALALFPQCITFIEKELEKGHGVLVHCHAGMSRSVTIVAAYLMYANNLDASAAMELITKARPGAMPNEGFLEQLDVFYAGKYKVSKHNKETRMHYLERALEDVMRAGGAIPEDNMFPKYPRTPSDSVPPTPGGPRRRIRCKMCRRELATRDHMLDHGQVGPATPASVYAASPAASRRPSSSTHDFTSGFTPNSKQSLPRSASMNAGAQERRSILSSLTDDLAMTPARRRSSNASARPGFHDLQPLTSMTSQPRRSSTSAGSTRSRRPSGLANEIEVIREGIVAQTKDNNTSGGADSIVTTISEDAGDENADSSALDTDDEDDEDVAMGKDVTEGRTEASEEAGASPNISSPISTNAQRSTSQNSDSPSPSLMHASELAAHLNSHPNLAALRSPGILSSIGALQPMTKISSSPTSTINPYFSKSPPLLINSQCSGYFLEPMKWMDFFLEKGAMGGKIICPNKSCGAKLGNFDWAGVQCSCKQWVTPGFCIHRSKVDEIV